MGPSSRQSNERLRTMLSRVPRDDLADLFQRHGIIAANPDDEITALVRQIRKDGSHDLAYLFRFGEGVNYDEIVLDVAKRLKVEYDAKSIKDERDLELMVVQHLAKEAFEKLSPEERRDMQDNMKKLGKEYQNAWDSFLAGGGAGALALIQAIGPSLMFQVLKAFLIRFMAYRAAGVAAFRAVGLLGMAIPVVNVALAGLFLVDLFGPAYRKTVPTVFEVGLLRLEYGWEES